MRRTASWRAVAVQIGALSLGVVAIVALATACGGRGQLPVNPAGPSVPTTGTSASQSQAVPRHVAGVADGRFDFSHMWGSEWWQFYSDSDASGTLSHLGLATIHTRHVPNLETGALEQGEFTIVAANGDEIHGTYEGSGTYDPDRADLVHGVAAFVITGGTGRFLGATGTFNATFLEVLDDPTWMSAKVTWSLDGTVNY